MSSRMRKKLLLSSIFSLFYMTISITHFVDYDLVIAHCWNGNQELTNPQFPFWIKIQLPTSVYFFLRLICLKSWIPIVTIKFPHNCFETTRRGVFSINCLERPLHQYWKVYLLFCFFIPSHKFPIDWVSEDIVIR